MLARTTLMAIVLLSLLLSACSHPAGAGTGATRITMADCGGARQARPRVLNVICQTNDITARRLAWAEWGKPVATASGSAVVDLCAFSDCHNSNYQQFPIVVIASAIHRCGPSARAYSRLQYVFVGRSPFAGLPAHMNFSNYIADPNRPGPPRNQTVSLGC